MQTLIPMTSPSPLPQNRKQLLLLRDELAASVRGPVLLPEDPQYVPTC